MSDDFTPCPLADIANSHDVCEGLPTTTTVIVSMDPWTRVELKACATCARHFDNKEPSDDDIYNRHGVEGGIPYDTSGGSR